MKNLSNQYAGMVITLMMAFLLMQCITTVITENESGQKHETHTSFLKK